MKNINKISALIKKALVFKSLLATVSSSAFIVGCQTSIEPLFSPGAPASSPTSPPQARLSFSTYSLDFGLKVVGLTSSQTLTLSNGGELNATNVYISITGTEVTLANNNCGTLGSEITLSAGNSCTFDVVYSPATFTTISEVINLNYFNGITTKTTPIVAVSGTGQTPAVLAFSPASKAFGNVVVGNSSTQSFTLTNSGGVPATSLYVALATGTNFAIANNNCGSSGSTVTLAPGASCTFDASFAPVTSGVKADTINISYNDGAMAKITPTAALSGIALVPATLAFTPASKAYGNVTVGNSSTQSFTLTNSGDVSATGLNIGLATGTQFSLANNNCGTSGTTVTLAAGGTCTFDVIFGPSSSGAKTDTVNISYNNGVSGQTSPTVALSGTALAPATLAFSPTSKAYGNVTVGNSSTQSFTLSNSGSVSATTLYIALATGTQYALANNNCGTSGATVTLAASGSCTFDVIFTPTTTGAKADTINISYNNGVAAQSTPTAALSGTGVAPASLAFSPTSKAYGNVTVGNSSTQSFTLSNSGGVSATTLYIALATGTQYALANNNCGTSGSTVTLAASGSCTFDVIFTPTTTGAKADTINISYNDGVAAQTTPTAALSGTGQSPATLAFSPTSKAYGNVTVGNSSTQSFTLSNTGSVSATTLYIALATGTQYALANNNCGTSGATVTLAASGSCTFDVTFTPTTSGAKSDAINISYNNGVSAQITPTAALSGTGLSPATLVFSPTTNAYGNVTVGNSSTQSFTLSNSGGVSATTLYIALATGTQYALANNNCGTSGATVTLAASGSCTFDVIFTPTTSGAKTDTINISYNNGVAAQTTPTVALSGTGKTPSSLAFFPTSKAFGNVTVGNTSSAQSFTLTNSGEVTATSVYISLATGTQFALANNNCGTVGSQITLASGASCTFDATFSPLSSGAKTDTINISYFDGVAAQTTPTVALSGTGQTPATLAFSPTSNAYGTVNVGNSSTQSFTLTNSGAVSATSVYIALATGTQFALSSNNCGTSGATVTLAASGTCTFDVIFTPTTTGAKSDTINISYNNGVSAQTTPTVALTGTGQAPASLTFTPSSKAYGNVTVGNSSSQSFSLANAAGGASATVLYISLAAGTQYALANNNCGTSGATVTIAAGGSCTFDVVFTPTTSGAKSDTLNISYNNGVSAQTTPTVALSGTGLNPATLAFSPTSKAFGNVTVGSSSTQSFTLSNSGGVSATVLYISLATGTQYALANNNCGTSGATVTLAASGSCTFDVTFTPTTTGAKADTINISYNNGVAAQTTPTVALSGTGQTTASLAFSPTSKAYGNVTVGNTSTQSFTLTNSGDLSATSLYIALTTGTQFALASNTCGTSGSTVTLASGASCTFDINFTPTTAGAKSDLLNISFNNGLSAQTTPTVSLSGTGLTQGTFDFSSSSVTIAQTAIGSNTTAAAITVTNNGQTTITNAYISLSGTDFTLATNTCGTSGAKISLASAATCSFSVKYTPTAATTSTSGTVTYSFNNGVSTQSGTGYTASASAGANLEVPIELVDAGLASTTTATIFERTRTTLDTTAYDGTVAYYFEIVGANPDGVDRNVELLDSAGTTVATVTLLSTDTAVSRKRVVFTPTAGANNYRVKLALHATTAITVYTARILVQQTNATKTKIYIPLVGATTTASSLSDSAYNRAATSTGTTYTAGSAILTNMPAAVWTRTDANWSTIAAGNPWTFEVVLSAFAGDTAYASLFNKTTGNQVAATELSTTSTTPSLLSVSFAGTATDFTNGSSFDVRVKGSAANATYLNRAGLWLTLTSLTKGEVYYRYVRHTANSVTIRTQSRILYNASLFSNPTTYLEVTGVCSATPTTDAAILDDGANTAGVGAASNVGTVSGIAVDAAVAVTSRDRARSAAVTLTSGNNYIGSGSIKAAGNCSTNSQFLVVSFY